MALIESGEHRLGVCAEACQDRRCTAARRVTSIRDETSPHWRSWLASEDRCIVLDNSFCEWADTKPKKTPTWFALDEDRPLFAFAGHRRLKALKGLPLYEAVCKVWT